MGMAVLLAVVTLVYYVLGHGVAKGKRSSLWCGIGVSLGVGLLAYFQVCQFSINAGRSSFYKHRCAVSSHDAQDACASRYFIFHV